MFKTKDSKKFSFNLSLNLKKYLTLRNISLASIFLLVYTLCLLVSGSRYFSSRPSLRIGDTVPENIVAKKRIRYVNTRETEKRRDEIRSSFRPVFDLQVNVKENMLAKTHSIFDKIRDIDRGVNESYLGNNKGYSSFLKEYNISISYQTYENLLAYYRLNIYRAKMTNLIENIYERGVVARKDLRDEVLSRITNGLTIYRYSKTEMQQYSTPLSEVYFLENLYNDMPEVVGRYYSLLRRDKIEALTELTRALLEENLFYNDSETESKLREALGKVEPVMNIVEKGGVILNANEPVTKETIEHVNNFFKQVRLYNTRLLFVDAMYFAMLFGFVVYYMSRYFLNIASSMKKIIVLATEFIIILALAFFMDRSLLPAFLSEGTINKLPLFLIAWVPIIAIINTLLLGRRISTQIAIISSLALTVAFSGGIVDLSILILASLAAIVTTDDISKRNQILFSGIVVGVILAAGVLLNGVLREVPFKIAAAHAVAALVVGLFQSIFATGVLSWLEHFLDTSTIFRLLEISDFNNELMRELQQKAPGTYHHSTQLALLVENACNGIGANATLARVGAYYHDIGKMRNPSYYVENVSLQENKHRNLKPSLSVSIIKAHVKIGIEIGRKHNLPKSILDFIPQHHGTSTIRFFYNQALQEGGDVDKDMYSYPGPKPQSKEAGVLMMGDAIEAAVRSIIKPTPDKIEELINDLFAEKMRDGQLDQSGLTLGDIATIKKSMLKTIMNSNHERIIYPSEKEVSDNEKEAE